MKVITKTVVVMIGMVYVASGVDVAMGMVAEWMLECGIKDCLCEKYRRY